MFKKASEKDIQRVLGVIARREMRETLKHGPGTGEGGAQRKRENAIIRLATIRALDEAEIKDQKVRNRLHQIQLKTSRLGEQTDHPIEKKQWQFPDSRQDPIMGEKQTLGILKERKELLGGKRKLFGSVFYRERERLEELYKQKQSEQKNRN